MNFFNYIHIYIYIYIYIYGCQKNSYLQVSTDKTCNEYEMNIVNEYSWVRVFLIPAY